MRPSPGAVGPVSRLRRRYADTPAATLLTGLGPAVGPASRPSGGAMLTLLRPPFFALAWGFAPGALQEPSARPDGRFPAKALSACTLILAEGEGLRD